MTTTRRRRRKLTTDLLIKQLRHDVTRADYGLRADAHPHVRLLWRAHSKQYGPLPQHRQEALTLRTNALQGINLLEQSHAHYAKTLTPRLSAHDQSAPIIRLTNAFDDLNVLNLCRVIEAVTKKRSRYLPHPEAKLAQRRNRRVQASWTGVCLLEAQLPKPGFWDEEIPIVQAWNDDLLLARHLAYGGGRYTWSDNAAPQRFWHAAFGVPPTFLIPVDKIVYTPPHQPERVGLGFKSFPTLAEFEVWASRRGIPARDMIVSHWRRLRDIRLSGPPTLSAMGKMPHNEAIAKAAAEQPPQSGP